MNRALLWVAQGFGVGRIPVAPGTFGSLIGLLWVAALLSAGSVWFYVAGTIAGLALSVWLCGIAEKILGQRDPGSVVLDEITAMPVCFIGWVFLVVSKTGAVPSPHALAAPAWTLTVAVFVAFRFFDVVKPWPVRQSQSLPGGWGVTVDDVLAAVYVNVLVLTAIWLAIGNLEPATG